ncbi:4493_t:CDS:2 [Entrophospora sp. SA101]|nr:4493_t:CDS:2 [Entrophospora sp. SA101]
MDMIPGPVILTLAQDMLDCSIRSTSKNLTRNGRNDVNNNNSSTQVLDSSRLHQDSGGSGVKQFGAINDVNASLKNIAAPSNCNISFIPQEFDSTLYPPYWNQSSSPPSFSTPFLPPPTDDRVDE